MEEDDLLFEVLNIDPEKESKRIEEWVRNTVLGRFGKKGVVIGLSGGIDSSVCAAICVNALGKERVLGLFTPEKECKKETNELGRLIADHLDVESIEESITEALKGFDCYSRRNEGIRYVIPEYEDDWGSKVVIPNVLESNRLSISDVVVRSPQGKIERKRMNFRSYLQVVAASNIKQRSRKIMEYYHAEKRNFAVIGTPNKLECDLGFFVKFGDGASDLEPIAHLYKTQVYELGRYYGLPEQILMRPPTTDTYSMPQSQEEFYFSLPFDRMDLALYAYLNDYAPRSLCTSLNIGVDQAERVFDDIRAKLKVAQFLHLPPIKME